jgi:predicted MPP superfamily phosphohydrolase
MNDVLLKRPRSTRPARSFVKRMLWSAAGSCALGGLFTWRFEDHWLRVERLDMPLRGLGDDLVGATLVQISDLHCSPIVRGRYLHQCIEAVNRLRPDFVAVTGDFVTGPKQYVRRVAHLLRDLHPSIATVACLGNHDYGMWHPGGLGQMRDLHDYVAEQLARADLFVMLNERRVFRRGSAAIQFVGVEDYWSGRFDPHRAFQFAEEHLPTVVLCHHPDAAEYVSEFGGDWILAGHTHGTPTRESKISDVLLPTNHKHYWGGHYHLPNGAHLYVNRGLGYGRRISINARPEITVFTLRRAE